MRMSGWYGSFCRKNPSDRFRSTVKWNDYVIENYNFPTTTPSDTVFTVHCTGIVYTVYFTLYTVHNEHSTVFLNMLYTVKCTLYTVYYVVYSVHCSLNNVRRTLYWVSKYYVQCKVKYTTYNVQRTSYNVQRTFAFVLPSGPNTRIYIYIRIYTFVFVLRNFTLLNTLHWLSRNTYRHAIDGYVFISIRYILICIH